MSVLANDILEILRSEPNVPHSVTMLCRKVKHRRWERSSRSWFARVFGVPNYSTINPPQHEQVHKALRLLQKLKHHVRRVTSDTPKQNSVRYLFEH